MSHADRRSASIGSARMRPTGHPFPFWVLQLAEMIAAVVLVDVSVHVGGGGTLIAAALAFALLAAVAQGPLGLVRICPQRVHVALVVTAAALAAVAPAVPALRPDIEGIIVLEFAAVGLIRAATLTRDIGAVSRCVPKPAPVGDGHRHHRFGRRPHHRPDAPPDRHSGRNASRCGDPERGAGAGRAAGAAAESGKRLAASHRPAAEAQVKRSIRHAGRWAARFTSPPSDRRPPEA